MVYYKIDPYIFFYQDYNVHVLVIELFVLSYICQHLIWFKNLFIILWTLGDQQITHLI